jgi:hypothetical protein
MNISQMEAKPENSISKDIHTTKRVCMWLINMNIQLYETTMDGLCMERLLSTAQRQNGIESYGSQHRIELGPTRDLHGICKNDYYRKQTRRLNLHH